MNGATEGNDESDEGEAIASPVPTDPARLKAEPRYTVTGYAGVWRLVADLTTGRAELDVTRPRGPNSILAALGLRLVELERTDAG